MAESTDTGGGVGAEIVPREVAPPPGGSATPPPVPDEQTAQKPIVDNANPEQPVVVSGPRPVGPSRQDLMSAIEALPERFISGVKEAFPMHPGQTPPPAPQENSGDQTAAGLQVAQSGGQVRQVTQQIEATHQEPTKKSFLQWWFD